MSKTLLVAATKKLGSVRQGLQAIGFVHDWVITSEVLKANDFKVDDMARVVGKSRAQLFRDQGVFRAAFPDLETPQAIADLPGNEQLRRSARSLAALKGLDEREAAAQVAAAEVAGLIVDEP